MRFFQGQISAQGILRLWNPNLGPNSGKRILDARISDPNSWVEFFGPIFSRKRGPLENSPSRNSPPKIHLPKFNPENWAKKFTLHLCRAIWLRFFHARKGKRPFKEKPSTKAIFPFSRGENRISQGVENRGSLISMPCALRVKLFQN